jgi:spermidine/putrescine transport system substrate-binding protein
VNRRIFLMGVPLTACALDRRRRLNVFNWSNYIARNTIPDFEREFNVRVRYSVYESNEEMLAKVMTGNSGWDIVFPTHTRIPPMARNGLLAKLDHTRLPNLPNLEQQFQSPAWDPALTHSVPYMWNATGIVYNSRMTPAPERWADLWNPRWQRRLTMLDDAEDVLGACLFKLGLSFDSTDLASLLRAKAEAVSQKRIVRAYLNAEVRDQLVSGDVLAAQAWSTTAQQAIGAAPNLRFIFPMEGYPLYADNAVILRESKRRELSHEFLNYLLRPNVAAAIATEAETATANGAARKLLAASVRDSPTLYPAGEVRRRGVWPQALPGPAIRMRDRLWTEIKSA